MDYECRYILIIEDQNHFSYLVLLPEDIRNGTACVERGFEEWDPMEWKESHEEWEPWELDIDCISTFQG